MSLAAQAGRADLSIIIVNYNTREPLSRCLESIRAHRGELAVQTIVVDNASKDGSAAMVRAHAPDVTLIEPGHNTWFSGGNRLGLDAALAPYTLILNADTVVQPGMLQSMLAHLNADPNVGAVCPQMRFPDGRIQRICSRQSQYADLLLGYTFLGALLPAWRDRRRAAMWYADWDRTTGRAVEVIPHSCKMGPTALFREAGIFDPRLRLYFTDDDGCWSLRERGYSIHFLAETFVLHEEHASVSQVQRLASELYFSDLVAYCRKRFGLARAALLRLLTIPTRTGMDIAQRLRGERRAL
jgi:GT2 family glycosyltransferase